MVRRETQTVGIAAERFAATLLEARGFVVRNLNDERTNYPLYDLVATKGDRQVLVSVKCARAKRELRLGKPHMLARLDSGSVVMAFLPAKKGEDIQLVDGGYELLVIPGSVARDEALDAHRHYASSHPGSADHPVMVKDKIDRAETTRSGAVFRSWHARFKDSWAVIETTVRS